MWQAFVNHLELANIVFSTYCVLRKKALQSTLRLGRASQLNRVCLRAAETSTHFRGSTLGCVGCKVQPPLPTCTAGSDTNFHSVCWHYAASRVFPSGGQSASLAVVVYKALLNSV